MACSDGDLAYIVEFDKAASLKTFQRAFDRRKPPVNVFKYEEVYISDNYPIFFKDKKERNMFKNALKKATYASLDEIPLPPPKTKKYGWKPEWNKA